MSQPFPGVNGRTRPFAVLGHPIAHTLSPVMHNAALRALGMNAIYLAFDVKPEDLIEVLRSMGRMGFGGVNLTIPHKEVAFRGVDHLEETAIRAGSVNTIVFREDGSLEGHSTDGYGLTQAVKEAFEKSFENAEVLILGCGGAGRAAALEASERGAARIRLANRNPERAEKLAQELYVELPLTAIHVASAWPPPPEETRSADLLLNSTALGMKPDDDPLLTPDHFHPGQALLDMTYVHRETPMMKVAREAGAASANGLGMLLHQGVRSFEIWTGTTPPLDPMRAALRETIYGESSDV
ncbi:MAG: shikimate dehydrogenase [Verrucomicrobia bacterium]|nr:shikimate dehydrogenase [Verrucomicrobiota bacterium]MCH8510741.1 shikimate dehydrogenase [Kiritimatiellia bacterium]